MADVPILKAAGLHTSNNEFSGVPEGALTQAENVVIRHPGVVEPRRGYSKSTYSVSTERVWSVYPFGDAVLVHHGPSGTTDEIHATTLARDTGSAFSDYAGTIEPADGTAMRMKAAEAQQNIYFATANGVMALESAAGALRAAGVPRAGTPRVSLTGGTMMAPDRAVAYRVVWGRKDAHGRLELGWPSGRAVLINPSTGALSDAVVRFTIPDGVTTDFTYRVYRSEDSATAAIDPSDELYQVYENAPTATDLTNGYIQITDATPELLLADPLYTNPSQPGGELQANARPPFAHDLVWWNNRLWYANTKLPQRLEFHTLAPPQDGDTFYVFGQSYSAEETATSGAVDAWVLDYADLGASPTASQKIQQAAQRLVDTINYRNQVGTGAEYGTVRAYYASSVDDLPGKILIEALDYTTTTGYLGWSAGGLSTNAITSISPISDVAVSVTAASTSRAGGTTVTVTTASAHGLSVGDSVVLACTGVSGTPAFHDSADANFPAGVKTVATVPSTTTFTYAEAGANATMTGSYRVHRADKAPSDNDRAPHRVYYSKLQEPAAVPYLNYIDVGSKTHAVLRIVAQRDKLVVFKADGIYVITGEEPFRCDLLDDTVRLLAADSVANVSNATYALTNQGVVSVSDAGVRVVSRPIERDLLQNIYRGLSIQAFAVGCEMDREYRLWLATEGNDYGDTAYVYNALTNTWVTWPLEWTCAYVVPTTGVMKGGGPGTRGLYAERRAYSYMDYCDALTVSPTVSSTTATTATLSAVTGIVPGSYVRGRTSGASGVVESVDGLTVTWLATSGIFKPEIVDVYAPITSTVEWAAVAPGGPNTVHQFAEATYHFRRYGFLAAEGTFASDRSFVEGTAALAFSDRAINTDALWADRALPRNRRVLVPTAKQISTYLAPGFTITEAGALWALNGITLHLNHQSERNSR